MLFYDDAGGEPLGVRVIGAAGEWKQFHLYRRVPASGQMAVTLALTGLGVAYFDDVRIEPLVGGSAYCPAGVAQAEKKADAVRPAAATVPANGANAVRPAAYRR